MTQEWLEKPIKIALDFDANWFCTPEEMQTAHSLGQPFGHLFRYELELATNSVIGAAVAVKREALSYRPKGRLRRIFDRGSEGVTYLGKEMEIRSDDARLGAVKENASVLSTLAKLNHPLMSRIWSDLKNIQSNSWPYRPSTIRTETVLNHYIRFPDQLENLQRELGRIDVGISGVDIVQNKGMPPYFLFFHDGLVHPILLEEESAGTSHFLHMFPIFEFLLADGHVGVFDEFDCNLHPDLVTELLGWFRSPERNLFSAQIFIALHNVAVLDQLEKEEVFFVEKSSSGATEVFGAQDVSGLRRDVNLEKKYRGGALGALPNIG